MNIATLQKHGVANHGSPPCVFTMVDSMYMVTAVVHYGCPPQATAQPALLPHASRLPARLAPHEPVVAYVFELPSKNNKEGPWGRTPEGGMGCIVVKDDSTRDSHV